MFRALIVSQFIENRLQLQQMVEHTSGCREVVSVHEPKEAHAKLSSEKFNVVFIAGAFGEEDIAHFIEKARRTPGGQDSAYVLVMKPEQQNRSTISNGMLVGLHGFLCEPFTVQAIEEITNLAQQVSAQNTKLRLKAATGLMISNLVDDFQEKPKDDAPKGRNKDLWQEVQESCDTYKKLTGHSVTSAVVNTLHQLPPSNRISNHQKITKRVRYLFEGKLKKRIQALRELTSGRKDI